MAINIEQYKEITAYLGKQVALVAVSKIKPVSDIQALYDLGQRDFGENYVQELVEKQLLLPSDIRWHFIGHLQSNKVKYIAPFVHLIHGVDSFKLLSEIDKQAKKNGRVIDCLLQVYIAREESKFGFSAEELAEAMQTVRDNHHMGQLNHVRVVGLMGMASFTEDQQALRNEFTYLKGLFDDYFPAGDGSIVTTAQEPDTAAALAAQAIPSVAPPLPAAILSMGMSNDHRLAIECGSNLVRIGSLLFGMRQKP